MVIIMQIGISSSCLYPMQTEDALRTVCELGARTAEIFFNSPSELRKPFLDELNAIKDFYGTDVRSIHPFTSAYETYLLFSDYKRRTSDGIEFYKNYFETANVLGAKIVVLHGKFVSVATTPEEYAESFILLSNAAREAGVYIAQENVHNHHCGNPAFMKAVAGLVGEDFRMVLDIKQCRRCEVSEFDFIKLLGDRIMQVHISDCLGQEKCLAPGEGEYDFVKLFDALNNAGYNDSAIIELYRKNFGKTEKLAAAKAYLENL